MLIPLISALVTVLILTAALTMCLEVGRRAGQRRGTAGFEGLGTAEGALFALLGLLLAFSFSSAATRFDGRRELIVKETNAIGTAYLRLDLLPPEERQSLRVELGRYVDMRLDLYRHIHDFQAYREARARVNALQGEIWTRAVAACQKTGASHVPMLVLPALNEMIDVTTTRAVAAQAHTPLLILGMLVVLSMICSVLAGYGMARVTQRSNIHIISFAITLAVTITVILDYEFPRVGIIRLDPVDRALVELRKTMP
jgi:ABC-type glycerol-3-phosphate transport system permease component